MEIDSLWKSFCNEESWKLEWENGKKNGGENEKMNEKRDKNWERNNDGTVKIKK